MRGSGQCLFAPQRFSLCPDSESADPVNAFLYRNDLLSCPDNASADPVNAFLFPDDVAADPVDDLLFRNKVPCAPTVWRRIRSVVSCTGTIFLVPERCGGGSGRWFPVPQRFSSSPESVSAYPADGFLHCKDFRGARTMWQRIRSMVAYTATIFLVPEPCGGGSRSCFCVPQQFFVCPNGVAADRADASVYRDALPPDWDDASTDASARPEDSEGLDHHHITSRSFASLRTTALVRRVPSADDAQARTWWHYLAGLPGLPAG